MQHLIFLISFCISSSSKQDQVNSECKKSRKEATPVSVLSLFVSKEVWSRDVNRRVKKDDDWLLHESLGFGYEKECSRRRKDTTRTWRDHTEVSTEMRDVQEKKEKKERNQWEHGMQSTKGKPEEMGMKKNLFFLHSQGFLLLLIIIMIGVWSLLR